MNEIIIHRIKNYISKTAKNEEFDKELDKFFYYNNRIIYIEGLHNFNNLMQIYLGNNNIRSFDMFEDLINLETLYLQNNYITKIDKLDKLKKLKYLILENNRITTIENLDKLVSLRQVNLLKNPIKTIYYGQIPEKASVYGFGMTYNELKRRIRICTNVKDIINKAIVIKSLEFWYKDHHLMKPSHPYRIKKNKEYYENVVKPLLK